MHACRSTLEDPTSGLGVGRESIVGVMLERSAELVASVWAVLKAGAAYLPLDPELPEQRLAEMMEDAGVEVMIVGRGRGGAFGDRKVVEVEVDLDARWPEAETALGTDIVGSQLAYVIYTSGSTGRAKGVMCTHEGLRNRLEWMGSAYPLERGDVVLQKTPYSFDVSVWELFWALCAGQTLEVAKAGGHRDARYLIETIESRGVTVCHFVPSMLTAFLEELRPGECGGLRRVFASGEALTREQIAAFAAKLPAVDLVNLYGPTEASIDVTYWDARSPLGEGARVPIGRPLWNTRAMVLGPDHGEVGLGMTGELCLGGVQLARGYVGRPELTAERFVPDPNSAVPGARTYRTGDVARWNHAGQLEYLGRIDHQVKLRGFRIELGEIESTLQSEGSVSAAVVVLREDVPGQKYLAGYVVAEPGTLLAEEGLRAALASKLPGYMVPTTLTVLERLPLNSSGKVDRKALPRPERANTSSSYARPRTWIEDALVELWRETLGLEQVGVEDDFFALGGTSLSALRMISRVEKEVGKRVPLGTLFSRPTIGALASAIAEASEDLHEWLIPLQAEGTRSPLIIFPALSGDPRHLAVLAPHLGADQPLWGLYAGWRDTDELPPQRLEEMAAAYVRAIRELRPHGPYQLCAFSAGCAIALYAARQLMREGDRVLPLVLIDGGLPGPDEMRSAEASALSRYIEAYEDPKREPRPLTIADLRAELDDPMLDFMAQIGLGAPATEMAVDRRELGSRDLGLLRLCRAVLNAMSVESFADTLDVEAVLITSQSLPEAEIAAWKDALPSLTVHRLDCSHGQIVDEEPFISQVASILRDALR